MTIITFRKMDFILLATIEILRLKRSLFYRKAYCNSDQPNYWLSKKIELVYIELRFT